MPENIVFVGCHDGTDFESKVVDFLNQNGFKANRVGNNDGGADIVAKSITKPTEYTFNIQCRDGGSMVLWDRKIFEKMCEI